MNLTTDEYECIMAASPVIGEHLETLGKSNMAEMTEIEWLDFIAFTYSAVCIETRKVWDNDVPY